MICFPIHTISLCLLLSVLVYSCSTAGNTEDSAGSLSGFSYDLASPDELFKLHSDLREISGVSWYRDGKIACIQDEKATIYLFDLEEGKISATLHFGKNNDFEDIVLLRDTAWVLTSKGTLYRIADFTSRERKVTRYSTQLSERNDTEGLAFDNRNNSLLIACKNEPDFNEKLTFKGLRAVYSFDILNKKLNDYPALLIDPSQLDDAHKSGFFKRISVKLAVKLKLTDNEVNFKPSGLAIHPFTKEIYILSATASMLIVMDRNSRIIWCKPLESKLFNQPEGICFSPEGDLYISNEGGEGKGTILEFKYRAL